MDKLVKWPATVWALCIAAVLFLAIAVARAPTSFTGKLPIIGEALPFEFTATYIILFGPVVALGCVGALWMYIAFGPRRRLLLGDKRRDGIMLAILFALIAVLSIVLSLQYFFVLAPAELCATRPHFDFLLHGFVGLKRVFHCMSGTEAINAKAPFYIEHLELVQSWSYVILPLITIVFLRKARRAWARG